MVDKHTLADGPPGNRAADALNTGTQNLAGEPTLADGTPSESRIDALNGRQTYFGRWTSQVIDQRCLEYQYTKIGR